ncbi:hypothetical protein ACHAPT_011051 [Fusarium lateritium]
MTQGTHQIFPGATWTGSNGRHIQAHGGGILKVESKYYWHGEDKTEGATFRNVNCYSSSDLIEWNYEGAALTRQESGDLGPERVVERPKVVFNKASGQYVMWMHIDDSVYSLARVGVATCEIVNGQFSYRGSFRPMECASRDMGVFVDDDDKAYLMSEDRKHGVRIFELSEDYLSVAKLVHLFPEHLESPAMVKQNGLYYLFASQLTYWYANDNQYTTSTSLTGPWAPWKTFAKVGSNTYDSQVTFVLPTNDSSAIYMGDRWEFPPLPRSTYVWLPLDINGTSVTMDNAESFVLDATADGEVWTRGAGPSKVHAPSQSAADQGHKEREVLAKFEFETTTERLGITLAFQYTTSDDDREQGALVTVDGDFQQTVAFLPSATPETVALSTVHVKGSISSGSHVVTVNFSPGEVVGLDIKGVIAPEI